MLQGNFLNHKPASQTHSKAEGAKRPTISSGCTAEDWKYFNDIWTAYKTAAGLTGTKVTSQLLDCCHDSLRKTLFHNKGNLTEQDEPTILEAIREIVVIQSNLAVSQKNLLEAKQDRDEPIRTFLARLRGLASMCQLTCDIACTHVSSGKHTVSFTDKLLKFVIITGIVNTDIQADILSHTNQKMTLSELIQFVEAKEAGKKSTASLTGYHSTDAVRSSYKRESNKNNKGPYQPNKFKYNPTDAPTDNTYRQSYGGKSGQNDHPIRSNTSRYGAGGKDPTCDWCGYTGHGDGWTPGSRDRVCPAWGKKCTNCTKYNHFAGKCISKHHRAKTSAVSANAGEEYDPADDDYEGAIFLSAIHTSSQ